jgi:hypothetical protein
MPVVINPTPRAVAPTPMTTLTSTAPANVHFIMPTPITIATGTDDKQQAIFRSAAGASRESELKNSN